MSSSEQKISENDQLDAKLDLVLDIGIELTIELGSKLVKLKELLQLNKNSIIELDKNSGEPLDVKANGQLIARGEVVTINDKYGLRLTEIVSKSKRIENI